MDIGKLNKRISFYKFEKITDQTLATTERRPVLIKECWASLEPRTGSLLMGREAGTKLSKTTHVIKVRSRILKNVTPDCYVTWKDEFKQMHKFEIDYILPPAGNSIAMIYCSEEI